MSQDQTTYKHAPWSKKILIPLWSIQLLLSTFQVVWACLNLSLAVSDSDLWGDDRYKVIAWALNLLFNLKLSIYIIFIIIKFANFQLTTMRFRTQSIYAVFVGLLVLFVYLFHEAGQHVLAIILMGCEVVVSIAICLYVVVILRMVRRGELEEMKRPGIEEVVVEVELESGSRKELPRM